MRLKKNILQVSVIITSLFLSFSAYAQSAIDQFNKAKAFYENNDNANCIALLQSIEKQVGANPKIYSLYINAYVAEKDYVHAKIALSKFKKLTGSKTSESIQAVLDLEKEIDNGVNTAESSFNETLQKKRMQEADKRVASLKQVNQQKKATLQSAFDKTQATFIKTASAEELATYSANSSVEQKRKAYQLLRQTKTLKQNITISFANGSDVNIEDYTFEKYNADGSLAISYHGKWDKHFVQFSDTMLTEEYAMNLAGKTYLFEIDEGKLISINGDEKKVEKRHYEVDKSGYMQLYYTSYQTWYRNLLVKDSTVYTANNLGITIGRHTYDENDRIKSSYFKSISNKDNSADSYKYTYPTPSECIVDWESKDGSGSHSRSSKEKINNWGDVTSNINEDFTARNSHTYDVYAQPIYTYTIYENKAGDGTPYNLTWKQYNLRQYQDGYQSGYDNLKLIEKKELEAKEENKNTENIDTRNGTNNTQTVSKVNQNVREQISANIEQINKLLQKYPNNAVLYNALGKLYLLKGDKEKAVECYKKAASMGNKDSIDWLKKNGY